MMKPFNRLAIPGSTGCPKVGHLCNFWMKNDRFFLGFIPQSGEGIVAYPSPERVPLEIVKMYQEQLNQFGKEIFITQDQREKAKIN